MPLTALEKDIIDSISVPSKNDPERPEFPPDNPHWPSTPIFELDVPGFDQVFIKDESVNPTGTHKDRMAWEMVVTYRDLLRAKADGNIDVLPHMSIISSGSAALAIQTMLQTYRLPNLKVLVDYKISEGIRAALESIGCEVYSTDLSKQVLYTEDILRLTNNIGGIDITSDDSLGPFDVFYDWMSYEIINENADYVFVPYGTGHLFENIVSVAVREASTKVFHDKRFRGNSKQLPDMHFIGATTNSPDTIADKLYSPHLPFVHFDINWIQTAKQKGYLGKHSNVFIVQEQYLQKAMSVAEQNNVVCEPSGIAGLAMMLQSKDVYPRHKKMLIVNTGKSKLH